MKLIFSKKGFVSIIECEPRSLPIPYAKPPFCGDSAEPVRQLAIVLPGIG
jgi:hypothetical protein